MIEIINGQKVKYCPKCKIYKDINEFGISRVKKDGLVHWCKICLRAHRLHYQRQYRANNPQVVKKHQKTSNEKDRTLKKEAIDYKGSRCSVCQYDRCAKCLDFHHLDPKIKKEGISDMIGRKKAKTLDGLKEELDKTILLCVRCHRELHAGLITI